MPIYNEKENLPPLFNEISTVMSSLGEEYEVICVDDGSNDGSRDLIRHHCQLNARFHLLGFRTRRGQSAAIHAGFTSAKGEYVITMDADRQNDPADIPKMISYLDRFDVIIGWRRWRQDPLLTKIASKIANAVRNRLTQETISDTGCSLKIMRRDILTKIPPFIGMHRFLPTLMRMQGAQICEVQVHHRPRSAGQSKYGISNRFFSGLRDLLAVRWLQDRAITYEIEEQR